MQGCAPGAVDLGSESAATKTLYGLDEKTSEPFGRQCLMARRLVERGVRFVQIFAGGVGNQNADTWDAHDDIKTNHTQHAAETDRPMAGLLTDLKARGLLDTTLVIMHSEFGRMPISQRGVGRDHNPGTQTVLMAGAGINGGQVIGSSDEFGYKAMEQPISYHDLHATMLHLMGLDHTKLTYRFNGRDMRLTDVYGTLIPQIVKT
jgi:membrane-anchored protein YejM (alkaline phosphatase superfamily)